MLRRREAVPAGTLAQRKIRREPYAVYGPFYDATQPVPDGAQYRQLLTRHHPRAQTLLEIACGTGAHLVRLAPHYEVEGLDVSSTMLRYARKRLPGVLFHEQSMAGFEIDSRFDAIVCPYDSINHLPTFAEWARTFKAARRHLNPGGVFIFDVNTEHRLTELSKAPPWIRRFGENYLMMNITLVAKGSVDWEIRVFERMSGPTFRLHYEAIRERAFAHERIKAALRTSFRRVWSYDASGWSRPKASSRRLFYVCQ